MICPHCKKISKTKVHESRPADGNVWRRRFCMGCFKVFVTQETTCEIGTSMPPATWSSNRLIDRKPKPEQQFITNDAAHLQSLWR